MDGIEEIYPSPLLRDCYFSFCTHSGTHPSDEPFFDLIIAEDIILSRLI